MSTAARVPSITHHTLPDGQAYTATAGWMRLHDSERPIAEVFFVGYTLDGSPAATRPVTFIFNGGPGAASAYLHVGALGPKRVWVPDDGRLPPSPARLVDNEHTWLAMSDLVFIDPVGTGFSRTLPPEGEEKPEDATTRRKSFWDMERDLEALGEVIRGYLSGEQRWSSPVLIAGESYGGFRVARLIRQLQEKDGVGLSGAILISPALEFSLLEGGDYDVLHWIDKLPTMAAAGLHHGRAAARGGSLESHMAAAEELARERLAPVLIGGAAVPQQRREAVFAEMAALTGLPVALIAAREGRVDMVTFCRSLLADERMLLGLYDASVTAADPFPDRTPFEGPDPTLAGLARVFTAAINTHLRGGLGVEEQARDYHLLSYDVFESWRYEKEGKGKQGFVGAVDHIRFGMSLNPDMKVWITHGYYDLVTPYFSSNRLVDLMRLPAALQGNLTCRHFEGGHMFYTWRDSRQAFFDEACRFYAAALGD